MDVVKDFNTFLANEENIESLKGFVESLQQVVLSFLGSILSSIVKNMDVIVAGFSVFATLKFASLAYQLLNINKHMTVTTLLSQAIKDGPFLLLQQLLQLELDYLLCLNSTRLMTSNQDQVV